MKIKFKKLNKKAKIPFFAHKTDAGLDICSVEDKVVKSKGYSLVSTGLAVEIPIGYEIQVRARSGLALNHGIFLLNGIGTIDSGYRGEIKIILANFSDKDYFIKSGDRIAQLVVGKLSKFKLVEVENLNTKSNRGDSGFGSSGK